MFIQCYEFVYVFEAYGIFPKNPALKRFLVSGPAIAAALRLQHGFECKHSREQCFAIETYAALGGDCGLTEDSDGIIPNVYIMRRFEIGPD